MAAPPLLVLKNRSGTPAVYRMIGTTLTQVGNTFGTVEPLGTAALQMPTNRVIQFQDNIYVWHMNEVRKFNSNTDDWDVVYTLSPTLTAGEEHIISGLFVYYINNAPHLGGVYSGSTIGVRRIDTVDGTSWTTAQLTNSYSFAPTTGIKRPILFRNSLYMLGDHNDVAVAGHTVWDTATDTVSRVTGSVLATGNNDMCAFGGNLYRLAYNPGTSNPAIYYLSGSSWSLALNIDYFGNQTGGSSSNTALLFAPGDDNLYLAIYVTPAAAGWRGFRFELSGAGPGLAFIGGEMGGTVGYPQTGASGTLQCFVDTDTVPGTPATYLWSAPDNVPGSVYTQYLWNGPGAAMTQQSSGGDVAVAIPHSKCGGGERIWSDGELDVLITGVSPVPAGERISFKAYGGGDVKVGFRYGTSDELPTSVATLTNPSDGTLVANENTELTADGTTTYQVTWTASDDGVTNLARVRLVPIVTAT